MGRHNPFLKRRPNPKRKEPRRVGNGRVKLHGEDMTDLRRKAFERSGGKCDIEKLWVGFNSEGKSLSRWERCNAPITWETMELCHEKHGPRKSDELAKVKAGCKECHRNQHNAGGKPNPRKPGRIMTKTEAQAYLKNFKCFCGDWKLENTAFCLACLNVKITRQSKLDLKRLEGDDWLACVADCEKQILAWRPAE